MNRLQLLIFVLVIALLPTTLLSAPIDHLNVAQITVTDQSVFTQKRAGKKAFEQVIVKISGNPMTLDNTQIRRSATSFEQYLVSSSYIQEGDQLIYKAEFNQRKVIDLLRSEGLNIWGARRPSGLLWLVIEDDATKVKSLITQQSGGSYADVVEQASYQRGVEIVLPIGDLTDSMNVSPLDVWGLFSSSIYNNSERYKTNYVIGAKIGIVFDNDSASEKMQLSYFVTNGQNIKTAEILGDDIFALLAEFINEYSSYLANLYAIDASETTELFTVNLSVSKIDSLIKYRKVLDILGSLTVTKSVELVAQAEDIATFKLMSNVSPTRLKKILELEKNLYLPEYQRLDPNLESATVAIDYEWRGN